MENKENTAYYFLGAILAYYLYTTWKKKQAAAVAPGDQTTTLQTLLSPASVTPGTALQTLQTASPGQMVTTTLSPTTSSNTLMPNTYQTFYGQIKGVPHTC
jgi:hypothetical protein